MSDPLKTSLTLTSAAAKAATLVGEMATRESVQVTLVGFGSRIEEGLVLALIRGRTAMASCEIWTAEDDDAVGTLDLNKAEIVAAVGVASSRTFNLCLWSIGKQALVIDTTCEVRRNRYEPGMSAPTPLAPWGVDLTEVLAEITAATAAVATHMHDGAGAAVQAHAALSGAGVVSHAVLETTLAALEAQRGQDSGRIETLESWRTATAAALAVAQGAVLALQQWQATASVDLAGVMAANGALAARVLALESRFTLADLGIEIPSGPELRQLTGNPPPYGDFVKFTLTVLRDMLTRKVVLDGQ
jgi:hypothetical protein